MSYVAFILSAEFTVCICISHLFRTVSKSLVSYGLWLEEGKADWCVGAMNGPGSFCGRCKCPPVDRSRCKVITERRTSVADRFKRGIAQRGLRSRWPCSTTAVLRQCKSCFGQIVSDIKLMCPVDIEVKTMYARHIDELDPLYNHLSRVKLFGIVVQDITIKHAYFRFCWSVTSLFICTYVLCSLRLVPYIWSGLRGKVLCAACNLQDATCALGFRQRSRDLLIKKFKGDRGIN